MVEKFATITPTRVRLTGPPGQDLQAEVTIIPTPNYPFRILEVLPGNTEHIQTTLEERNGGYRLTVKNRHAAPGQYRETIHLKTDSPVKPDITIPVHGAIIER